MFSQDLSFNSHFMQLIFGPEYLHIFWRKRSKAQTLTFPDQNLRTKLKSISLALLFEKTAHSHFNIYLPCFPFISRF